MNKQRLKVKWGCPNSLITLINLKMTFHWILADRGLMIQHTKSPQNNIPRAQGYWLKCHQFTEHDEEPFGVGHQMQVLLTG